MYMQKIKSIRLLSDEEKPKYVFDAICDAPHAYITNNMISHNCILWVK